MFADLVKVIRNAARCVVLTGAGISAESGVPTFRGQDGLWKKFRPEELATMEALLANSQIVWEWYRWRRELIRNVQPNPGHYALVQLERFFDSFTLVTQNVDGLHGRAGSREVLEIHGNILRNKCADCGRPFPADEEIDPDRIPSCRHCGGRIRPDVVWFGELLPQDIIEEAFTRSRQADIFFSVGTSAIVHPAASLPETAKQHGAILVEINPEPTPLSGLADFRFAGPAGELLPELVRSLEETAEP